MISLNLFRAIRITERVFVRNLRTRRGIGPNPGLNKRLEAFWQDGIQIDKEDAEEFIEDSNSDLVNSGDAYSRHMKETLMGKHILPKHIVKQKYFKETMPNLLTWSEKEQIRHLATVHPDEWTPERLAESFPVTVEVVKKLLKYPWKTPTEVRIARHDATAMRNWRELKEGTLEMPEELRQRFLKFSERTIPPLISKPIKTDVEKSKPIGEFESIVTKCAAADKVALVESTNNRNTSATPKTKPSNAKDRDLYTLEELKNKVRTQVHSGDTVKVSDNMMLNSTHSLKPNSEEVDNQIILNETNEENTPALIQKKEVVVQTYPERIRIPKKAYRKGATYKVNDCFYDHDGRLLYRVIGMTGK